MSTEVYHIIPNKSYLNLITNFNLAHFLSLNII